MNTNYSINTISFNAGLTQALERKIACTDSYGVQKIQKLIKHEYGTKADFRGNIVLSRLFLESLNILRNISKKFNLPFEIYPPNVNVYNVQDLNPSMYYAKGATFGFSQWTKSDVLKNKSKFEPRSIFIKNVEDDAKLFDAEVENHYKDKRYASDSIFYPFLHELMHNVHQKLLTDKFGCYESSSKTREIINAIFSDSERQIISNSIGLNASKSTAELFADVMSKLICESMDNKNIVIRNPMDALKELPEFIQKFIKEQLS